MSTVLQIVTAEVLYFMAIASGIWLSHSGRPLNLWILLIHKLIGLGTVVLTSVVIWNLLKIKETTSVILIMVVSLAVLIVALIGSGAVLSFRQNSSSQVLRTHNITTVLGIIVSSITIYLLTSNSL